MNWETALVIGTMICAPLGAFVILYGIWRGLKRFFRRPTSGDLRDFTETH